MSRKRKPSTHDGRVRARIALGATMLALVGLAQLSLAVPGALAIAAPTATTAAAQQVEFASAEVLGSVDPEGSATSYYFQYGTTPAFGLQTSAAAAGAGSAAIAVKEPLTGLQPSTTYDYRLVATSTAGTVAGGELTFTTPKTPAPALETTAATNVSTTTAQANAMIDPEGVPTTYYFEYGTTAAYGKVTPTASAGAAAADGAVASSLTGLEPGTTYDFRVVAVSTGGTVVGGGRSFTTTRLALPTATTDAATGVSTTTATLNGAVDPDGVATSYYFEYGTTASYGHDTASRAAGSGTASVAVSEPLSGLATAKTYYYRVVATSAAGTVVGREATFTTTKTPAPGALTGAATGVGTTTATLTGTVNPDGVATSYYFLYGTKSPTTRTPAAFAGIAAGAVAASAPLSGLTPDTTYVYRLVADGATETLGATRSFRTASIPSALSLRSTSNPVAYGAGVSFDGALTGTGEGVRTVALETERYPYTAGFERVGNAELTSASGAFSFTLASVTIDTMVRAVTVGGSPTLASRVILQKALVRVTVHVQRHGRAAHFTGLLTPGGASATIEIQRRIGGRWVTIVRTTASPSTTAGEADYSHTIRRPHAGRYRVVAHMRDSSLVSGETRVLTLHQR